MRKVTVGVLNIVMPEPHNRERYVELFKKAHGTRRALTVRGKFAAILGGFGPKENGYYGGVVHKFFDLELTGKWLNLQARKPVDDAEREGVSVPEHLKPGLETFDFLFFPPKHRLFFVSRERGESFGPLDAARYFRALLNQPALREEFGEIEVTAEPDKDTLRKILAIPGLRRLDIQISPPNPDDFEDFEQDVKDRLKAQHARRMDVSLIASRGETLAPDNEIQALAEVAKSNGLVSGRGRDDEGNVVELSTKQHPLLETAEYDPDVEFPSTALYAVASDFLRSLVRRAARG
ncbi:hypothetical protein Tamer19_17380 [Cupriavidus sp. TA19]|uniref:DUF4747 family protein n=1 Tax=unclassified Cupriavidus TaxID=2640874 RepID=UPI0027294A73|nr:DUF4747 family protein [Cupriavidus sp. TA19]GLC92330.1 hypothetical protein Tamer19_17380 [Cupriavidus sp. TA19]